MEQVTLSRAGGIGELSRASGVKIETIRYYERIGLIPEPQRSVGGDRKYEPGDERRLMFIKRCRSLGFGLDEIRSMLVLVDKGQYACKDVHAITNDHLETIRERIDELREIEEVLSRITTRCGRDDKSPCDIVSEFFEVEDRPN